MLISASGTRFPRANRKPPRSYLAAGSRLARFSRRSLVPYAPINEFYRYLKFYVKPKQKSQAQYLGLAFYISIHLFNFYPTILNCYYNGLGTVVYVHFLQNVTYVVFNRFFTDIEIVTNSTVASSISQQLKNLTFTSC